MIVSISAQSVSDIRVMDYSDLPKQHERAREYDVLHYKIELEFDEDKRSFWGETTVFLTPSHDDFSTCVLDAETFTVTSVLDGDRRPLVYDQPEHKVVIHLSKAYNVGDTLSFTVSYVAELGTVDQDDYRRPQGTVQGLDFAPETDHNPAVIQTFAFPAGARHWFPCFDHPSDKATQEVMVTVKNDYRAISNGRLMKVTEDTMGQTKTFHWLQELPHSTYLFVVAAGPYEVIQDSLGSLPISYWVYKNNVGDAMRTFHKTPEIIAFFNTEFGYEYPWPKYDQIIIPGFSGGAESTTATFLGQNTIHDERAEQDFPSHGLVAHEAAHQWFGNLVTMYDWTHAWINESFATYAEYHFAVRDQGEDEAAVNLLKKKNAYIKFAHSNYVRPIVLDRWRYPGDNWDAHLYQKGATVIHMMRWIMGDNAFFRTLSHFLHKHEFQPVRTSDLMVAIKEATGQNLDWYFDQWIYKPGHPFFDVSYTWDGERKEVRMRIVQTQDNLDGVPIFKTPVVIGIVTSEGRRSEKVWLEKKVEDLELECPREPLMVRFDEGNYLLKEWTFEKGVDELFYQLSHDDVIGRMWAASELAKHPDDPEVMTRLKSSAQSDPFWAVRRDAVYSLGSFEKEELIPFFKRKARDENSKVRVAAMNALGNLRKQHLAGFLEQRFKNDSSYLVQAEALKSLGKCGTGSAAPLLVEASTMKSPKDVILKAAEWALKEIENQQNSPE